MQGAQIISRARTAQNWASRNKNNLSGAAAVAEFIKDVATKDTNLPIAARIGKNIPVLMKNYERNQKVIGKGLEGTNSVLTGVESYRTVPVLA